MKTKLLIGSILSAFLLISTASADILIPDESNYTPARPGVQYVEGQQGFSYSTFNNFVGNPNISVGARQGDEREFLLGKYCEGGVSGCSGQNYHNFLPESIKEGDVVRFEIYFHNNGEDSYDGGEASSPDARNVVIGINLTNIEDSQYDDLIRPEGFISASNAQYRTNSSNPLTIIRRSNGDVERTITDDMIVVLSEYGLKLEPIYGSAWLTMKTELPDQYFDGYLNGARNIEIDTEDPDTMTLNVTPWYQAEKMGVTFDKIPGCFRYSGAVYFDAVVTKEPETPDKPVCQNLKIDHHEPIYEDTLSTFSAQAKNTDNEWMGDDIHYSVDPGYGLFYTTIPNNIPQNPADYVIELPARTTILKTAKDNTKSLGAVTTDYIVEIITSGFSTEYNSDTLKDITPMPKPDPTPDFQKSSVLSIGNINPNLINNFDPDDLVMTETLTRLGESVEIPAGQTVYFEAKKPGNDVIHVKSVGTKIPACKRDFDIKPYQFCDNLLVNRNEKIIQNKLSVFRAKALDTDGDNFNAKITYSVEPRHGKFYLEFPEGLPQNNYPITSEFNPNDIVPEPEAGFCSAGGNIADFLDDEGSTGFTKIDTTDTTKANPLDPTKIDTTDVTKTTPATPTNTTKIPGTTITNWDISDIINFGALTDPDTIHYFDLDTTPTRDTPVTPIPNPDPTPIFNPSKSGLNSVLAFNTIELETDLSDTDIGIARGIYSPGPDYTTITVDPGTKVYFWAKDPGENVIHVKTECTDAGSCSRNFNIIASPLVPSACASLGLTSTPASPFAVGQNAKFSFEDAIDTNGNPLPADTLINWGTDTGGSFSYGTLTGTRLFSSNLSQTPILFENSTQEGVIVAGVAPEDPLFSMECIEKLIVEENPLFCENLDVDLRELGAAGTIGELRRNNIYELSADATYSRTHENTVTYRMDENYGTFLEISSDGPPTVLTISLRTLEIADMLTPDTLDHYFGSSLTNEIELEENESTLLITYSETPDENEDEALVCNATDFHNTECEIVIPFIVEPVIRACEYISLDPLHGRFDPDDDFTIFNITGDFDGHNGAIRATVTRGGLSKLGESGLGTTITFSAAEVAASGNVLSIAYHKPSNYDGEEVRITVSAVGDEDCSDTIVANGTVTELECLDLDIIEPDQPWEIENGDDNQVFQINVETNPGNQDNELYYTWHTTDGEWRNYDDGDAVKGLRTITLRNFEDDTLVEVWASYGSNGEKITACYDYILARGEEGDDDDDRYEEPEFEKWVFPKNKIDDADDLINIGQPNDTPYLTYMLIFEPGDAQTAEITETMIDHGNIRGNLGGYLTFKAMRINYMEEGSRRGKTMLKTAGYVNDKEDSDYTDLRDDSLENYEEEYECSKTSTNKICIDGDFNEVVNDFKNGNPIKFKNVDDIGQSGKLIIKYQMRNNTYINEENCKRLTAVDGCGEQFRNEAEYKAEVNNEKFSGDDNAQAIVICPFILTRAGGDVFFHDVIDTGVDVAKCSEVKTGEGPGITPRPPILRRVIKTGMGDNGIPDELQLILPSHDVCRYSNLSSNIEGYNDVLKHFSSTVCEMEADVAEEWKEENINKSIAANVTRIARWGQTLPPPKISNMESLNRATNKESGVFVRIDNDLSIGTLGVDFVIEAKNGIPAAQTYIVQNGDLYIDSNIVYGKTNFYNPAEIPSAAFIVIDGDIIISPDVTQIDGIIMAIDLDKDGTDGKVTQKGTSFKRLTINGNLVGDVYELFANRRGVGDPTKNEGSVTIYYDERLLLNTPPGISELIDVQHAIVPN